MRKTVGIVVTKKKADDLMLGLNEELLDQFGEKGADSIDHISAFYGKKEYVLVVVATGEVQK